MSYFIVRYTGYVRTFEYKTPNSTNSEAIKPLKLNLPDFNRIETPSINFVSFEIPVENPPILELLEKHFLHKKYPKGRLSDILNSQKKSNQIIEIKEFPEYYSKEQKISCHTESFNEFSPILIESSIDKPQTPIPQTTTINYLIKIIDIPIFETKENTIEKIINPSFNFIELSIDAHDNISNEQREVFTLSLEENKEVAIIKDIFLKRKPDRGLRDAPKPEIALPVAPKLTAINSLDDIKKYQSKIPQKSVRFDLKDQQKIYTPQKHMTQSSEIPFKIFVSNKNSDLSNIVSSINIENCYIVSLEIEEQLMDYMDLIVTWQTAVKICYTDVLHSEIAISSYLSQYHENLKKFDSILIVFIAPKNAQIGQEVLNNYKIFLQKFSIKFQYIFLDSISQLPIILSDFLEKYFKSIVNTGLWTEFQHKISDIISFQHNEFLNIYSSSIFNLVKSYSLEKFTEICNLLGTTSARYETLLILRHDAKNFN